ncbi:acyltransferase family protein [Micromonospora chersina]|uniref:acyltransferase family protein n=1 Tax=Micromonospora chersina TaxID=47854 RepID=UPI0033FC26EC
MTVPLSKDGSRLASLTGMRFLAALMVFASHAALLGYLPPEKEFSLVKYSYSSGWIGVVFFFVLSGFVLTWSVREGEPKRLFWRRRLVKIYPNYLVAWVAAIVLSWWAFKLFDFPNLIPGTFMVQSWYPNIGVIVSTNTVAWSMSCELFFYLMFPLLYRLIKRIPDEGLWWAAGSVTAVIAVVLPAIARLLPMAQADMLPMLNMSIQQEWFMQWFPLTRCLEFVLGMLMARIVIRNRWIGLRILPALALVAVGMVLQVLMFPSFYSFAATIVLPIALLIAAAAVADSTGRRSSFRVKPLVWLGTISYAFFLVHFLVLLYGHIPLGAGRTWPVPTALGILAGVLAATIVVAWLVTRLVEEPMMRRWARPRRKPSAPAEPVSATPVIPQPASAVVASQPLERHES